ncbi:hypothetical protein AB0937_09910 [Streptomyces sp. NPDC047880]|uniref:hypothetical protein n=1 Tax=Streptomyces sp. NPDC047880 TaxID=3155626 RepID=UPI00345182AD
MIQQVVHTEPGEDPAAVGPALAVAYALHAPTGRAAELTPTGRAAELTSAGRAAELTSAGGPTPRRASRSARAGRRPVRG